MKAELYERRDFYRMTLDCPLTCVLDDGFAAEGVVTNISSNGILFATDLCLREGDKINLSVDLHGQDEPPLALKGDVVRSEPTERHHKYKYYIACWLQRPIH